MNRARRKATFWIITSILIAITGCATAPSPESASGPDIVGEPGDLVQADPVLAAPEEPSLTPHAEAAVPVPPESPQPSLSALDRPAAHEGDPPVLSEPVARVDDDIPRQAPDRETIHQFSPRVATVGGLHEPVVPAPQSLSAGPAALTPGATSLPATVPASPVAQPASNNEAGRQAVAPDVASSPVSTHENRQSDSTTAPATSPVRPESRTVQVAPSAPVRSTRTEAPVTGGSVNADVPATSPPSNVGSTNSQPVANSSSTPAATPWNERAASVRSGTEIAVALPGTGWLYVGREYGDGAITLLGKERTGSDEVFRFRIGEAGDYGLWFQQQNAVDGSLVNERLAVRASANDTNARINVGALPLGGTLADLPASPADSDDRTLPYSALQRDQVAAASDAAVAPGGDPAGTAAGAAEGTTTGAAGSVTGAAAADPTAAADQSVGADEGGAADGGPAADSPGSVLASARTALENGDPGAIELAAQAFDADPSLPADMSDDELARFVAVASATPLPARVLRSFWRGVASSGSSSAPLARRQLLELPLGVAVDAPRSDRASLVREAVTAFNTLDAANEATAADALRVASVARDAGATEDGLRLFARAASLGRGVDSVASLSDTTLFEIAQLLERPGDDRDLPRAATIYRLITEQYPLSEWWEPSRSRLEYLRRHYFEVR